MGYSLPVIVKEGESPADFFVKTDQTYLVLFSILLSNNSAADLFNGPDYIRQVGQVS